MRFWYGQDRYLRWLDQDPAADHVQIVEACFEAHVSYELLKYTTVHSTVLGVLLFLVCLYWRAPAEPLLIVMTVLLAQVVVASYSCHKASKEAIALTEHPKAQDEADTS